jgi:hypothetical protein
MAETLRLKIHPDYPYVYETHLHTSEASACGRSTGQEMARACYEAGYTGIFVTNHFFYGNTCVDRSLPWSQWVELFCKGYENAKEEGDRLGLQVWFGWESNYQATEFLIYGLDKQWLLDHPEIRDCSIPEQFELVTASGGLVVHCHPFREESYIKEIRLFPKYVQAVETANATHTSALSKGAVGPQFDERATAYALAHDFPMTGGSDIHSTNLIYGGVAFRRKLTDPSDYKKALLTR